MSNAAGHRRSRRCGRAARRRGPIWIAGLLAAALATVPAAAYDTGPHFDMTRDALAAGLAPGASITQPAPVPCTAPFMHTAVADSISQVTETNETNNSRTIPGPIIC